MYVRDQDWDRAVRDFAGSAPYNFAVFEDFLTPDALTSVSAQISARWGDQPGPLASVAVVDIVELVSAARALEEHLPGLLDGHALARGWAFMNQQNVPLKVHADVGAVTLNLWLTPDEHNLDPTTGGLVLFDVKRDAAAERERLDSVEWAERHLAEHPRERTVVIGHRCNRAVLFDARTFHGSDRVAFSLDGPNTRRVNVSLVFA